MRGGNAQSRSRGQHDPEDRAPSAERLIRVQYRDISSMGAARHAGYTAGKTEGGVMKKRILKAKKSSSHAKPARAAASKSCECCGAAPCRCPATHDHKK
jgi:hypothetical protein